MPMRGAAVGSKRSDAAGCHAPMQCGLTMACCGTLVLKGAMVGGEAGRSRANAVPRFCGNND